MYGYWFVHKPYSNMVKTILTVVIVTVEGAYMSICKSLGPKKSSQYCMDFWIIRAKGKDYRVNFPFLYNDHLYFSFYLLYSQWEIWNTHCNMKYCIA